MPEDTSTYIHIKYRFWKQVWTELYFFFLWTHLRALSKKDIVSAYVKSNSPMKVLICMEIGFALLGTNTQPTKWESQKQTRILRSFMLFGKWYLPKVEQHYIDILALNYAWICSRHGVFGYWMIHEIFIFREVV